MILLHGGYEGWVALASICAGLILLSIVLSIVAVVFYIRGHKAPFSTGKKVFFGTVVVLDMAVMALIAWIMQL